MEIQPVNKSEIKEMILLCKEHSLYEQTCYKGVTEKQLWQFFQQQDCWGFLVKDKENIVGYFTLFKQYSTWKASPYLYVDCLYLKEEIRGQKFGTKIMKFIKEFSTEKNCKYIEWQTPSFNLSAIKFYEQIGGISSTKERFILK